MKARFVSRNEPSIRDLTEQNALLMDELQDIHSRVLDAQFALAGLQDSILKMTMLDFPPLQHPIVDRLGEVIAHLTSA